jgi:hypothetical protein
MHVSTMHLKFIFLRVYSMFRHLSCKHFLFQFPIAALFIHIVAFYHILHVFFLFRCMQPGNAPDPEDAFCNVCAARLRHKPDSDFPFDPVEYKLFRLISDTDLEVVMRLIGEEGYVANDVSDLVNAKSEPTASYPSQAVHNKIVTIGFVKNRTISQDEFEDEMQYLDSSKVLTQDKNFKVAGVTKIDQIWDKIIRNSKKTSVYVNFNLHCLPQAFLRSQWRKLIYFLREGEDSFSRDLRHDVQDIFAECLVLLGIKGHSTSFHIDWLQAMNIAFGCGDVDLNVELSRWFFVEPKAIDAFMNKYSFIWRSTYRYSIDDLSKVVREFRENTGLRAFCLKQYAGTIVYVPPGWLHCVINVQPCIKFAWDYLDLQNLPKYVQSHQMHQHLKVRGDYSLLEDVLVQLIRRNTFV